jgi:hypothetical protein
MSDPMAALPTEKDRPDSKTGGSIEAILSKGDVAQGRRSRDKAKALLADLHRELGVEAGTGADRAMEDFLIEAVLGAAWYRKRLRGASRKVWTYVLLNCLLVVGLPLGLMGLGKLANGANPVVAQITGVLTGVLALQKTLSVWYSAQQRYAAWYKASSDLKSIYYGFVQAWAGKADSDPTAFVLALRTAAEAARQVISGEQLDYYQKLTLPSFDVLDMLTVGRGAVSSFVTSLLPGSAPTTVTTVGRNALTAAVNAAPQGGNATVATLAAGGASHPGVFVRAEGESKPNDNPYTIVIVANPVLEDSAGFGSFSADQILSEPAVFEGMVAYIRDSIFGRLRGQREQFMAAFEPRIRVISIFDASPPVADENALVAQDFLTGVVAPRQQVFAAFLAGYQVNGRPLKADVVFAVTHAPDLTIASSLFTHDDDGGLGVTFTMDGRAYAHRFNNLQPGACALSVKASSVVALHEFSHAASSWTNGSVKDLYSDSGMALNPVNIREGSPPPVQFADYAGASYSSNMTADGLRFPPSYHCALTGPGDRALMDDFWHDAAGAANGSPETCMHDTITRAFLTDRIKALMSRP